MKLTDAEKALLIQGMTWLVNNEQHQVLISLIGKLAPKWAAVIGPIEAQLEPGLVAAEIAAIQKI